MKAKARLFKGIEFIAISELPQEQQLLLQSSPAEPERIKILIDGKIVENCLQYSKYVHWYTSVFANAVPTITGRPVQAGGSLSAKSA